MKFFELELNGRTLKLRLVSSDMKKIEKESGKSILDYVQGYSVTVITNLLRYMSKPNMPNFSEKDADMLYDELIDAGYTMEKIIFEVIYEVLVVSGFLTKEELEEITSNKETAKEKKKEKVMEELEK